MYVQRQFQPKPELQLEKLSHVDFCIKRPLFSQRAMRSNNDDLSERIKRLETLKKYKKSTKSPIKLQKSPMQLLSDRGTSGEQSNIATTHSPYSVSKDQKLGGTSSKHIQSQNNINQNQQNPKSETKPNKSTDFNSNLRNVFRQTNRDLRSQPKVAAVNCEEEYAR